MIKTMIEFFLFTKKKKKKKNGRKVKIMNMNVLFMWINLCLIYGAQESIIA